MRLRRPPRTTLIACTALLTLLGLATDAQASRGRPAPINCRSGRTVFRGDGVRAFVVVRQFVGGRGQPSSPYKTFYICSPKLRTPQRFEQGAPFTRESLSGFKIFGDRLGFVIYTEGVQSGSDTEVGWVDFRIVRVRIGQINASEGLQNESEEEPGLPRVPADNVHYAIAGDGTVAVLGEGGDPTEWEVCLLPVKLHSLGPPQPLFIAKPGQEGLDPHSLAITETSVTWRTRNGQPASAPR